jgi:streptogramin lyase
MAQDQRIGSELGGYRIESLIGRGGMGIVYLAEDVTLGRKVAIKLLAPELAEDDRFRERFLRESRLAASLEHPSIITIYEARQVDGSLYLAMRYVEGTDLRALIAEGGPLPIERALSIVSQVASALDAAHESGLIHRDVKPGNVLIAPASVPGRPDRVYLSDFGLTKRAASDSGMTGTGQFVGTLEYAAPEQFEGKPLDARTDVYSLGCVLYECLTGRPPFQRETEAALVYAHLLAAPPSVTEARPDLPAAIDEVVTRALAKAPADRFASCSELVAAAASALGVRVGGSVSAAATGTGPSVATIGVPSNPRRRTGLIAVGGGILVAGVIVAVVLALASGGSKKAPPSAASATGDRLAQVDPRTNSVTGRIAIPGDPSAVATGEGSVWVTSDKGNLSRVDPRTQKVTATIAIGNRPDALAVGEGAVWVGTRAGTLAKVDVTSNKVVATIPLGGVLESVAVGEGAVWAAASDGRVYRIDPVTAGIDFTARVAPSSTGDIGVAISVGQGGVWVARSYAFSDPNSGISQLPITATTEEVFRLSPDTGIVQESLRLVKTAVNGRVGVGAIAVTPSDLWATDPFQRKVYRLAPQALTIVDEIPHVGVYPSAIAIEAGGDLWVASSTDGVLFRIVPTTNEVLRTIPIGKFAKGVAVGEGAVWIAVDVP